MTTKTTTDTIYFVRNPDGSLSTFNTSTDVEAFFLRLVAAGQPTDGYVLYSATEIPIQVTRPSVTLGAKPSGRKGPKPRGPNGLPLDKNGNEYRPGRRAATPVESSTTTEDLAATLPTAPTPPTPPTIPSDFDAPLCPRFIPADDDVDDADPTPTPAPVTNSKGRGRRAAGPVA